MIQYIYIFCGKSYEPVSSSMFTHELPSSFEHLKMLFKFVMFGIELNKSILGNAASFCLLSFNEIGSEYFVMKSDFMPDV